MSLTRQRGAAAVELGILLIPLVIAAFGMTELGRAFYYYNGVVSSTRDAARYLSQHQRGEGEAEARCLAVYGNPQCSGGETLVPGLTTDMVRINYDVDVDTGTGQIDLVTVAVDGLPFQSLVPYVVPDITVGTVGCTMRQGT